MKKGIATPQENNGLKLTIPVKTRTPLEAFTMLRQGQPIDTMAAYYSEDIKDDFWMMDKTAKLHKLAHLKADNTQREKDILLQEQEIATANQISLNNAKERDQNNQATTIGSTGTTGQISQSRAE